MKTLKYLSVFLCAICMSVHPVWAASDSKTEKPEKEETLSPITINVGVLISTISAQGWNQTSIPEEWKGDLFDEIILLDDESFKLKEAG